MDITVVVFIITAPSFGLNQEILFLSLISIFRFHSSYVTPLVSNRVQQYIKKLHYSCALHSQVILLGSFGSFPKRPWFNVWLMFWLCTVPCSVCTERHSFFWLMWVWLLFTAIRKHTHELQLMLNNTILFSDHINIIPCNPLTMLNSLVNYFIEVQGTTTVIMSCSI